ncbi:tautomerase family protein [Nocardia testacea]|uniref:tautomerase family protein n=1 Tax=Nocardia testacea TaxID=248551 RepID=UPI0005844930|nr:tautomerase family protein [Nocardia testacea]
MPHLTVHVLERDLAGREAGLIEELTDAVVEVYGEWAREIVDIRLIGLPDGRWAIGGVPVTKSSPSVTFGIKEAAFERADGPELVSRLISGVTDAIVSVFGDEVRSRVTVEFVGTPAGRTGVGGVLAAH